jgi:chemotaxis protein CheD
MVPDSVVVRSGVENRFDETHPQVHLYPGHLFASAEPSVVRTILGSCVSVCLFDPRLAVGGLNHFLLARGPVTRKGDLLRYGSSAVAELVKVMKAHGCAEERLEAKLFGGGAIVPSLHGPRFSLAAENVAIAKTELARLGIPIVAEDTLGRTGRKLIFETHTGNAWVKEL